MQGTNFKKRIAIVTGANRGIGLATIQKLLDEEHLLKRVLNISLYSIIFKYIGLHNKF